MFVKANNLSELKKYFQNKIGHIYSPSEQKQILKNLLEVRFNMDPNELYFNQDLRFSESDLLFFREFVIRTLENEPFQYILGHTYFYDLKIKCVSGILIPRPETEELVDWILQENKDKIYIHDFCTGSGCIPLALKNNLKSSTISCSDFSETCLNVSKENALNLNLDIEVFHFDILNDHEKFKLQNLDVITANPPYIGHMEKKEMEANVLDFEPHDALFVDDSDLLIFYRKIAELAKIALKPSGKLYFEINEKYASETEELLLNLGYSNIEIRKDLQGKNRMLKAINTIN